MNNKSKNNNINNNNIYMSDNSVKTNGSGDSIDNNEYMWVAKFLAGPGGYLENGSGQRLVPEPPGRHGRRVVACRQRGVELSVLARPDSQTDRRGQERNNCGAQQR
ncbi:hypothetical protein DPMN_183838 [Dreissena polymorpha]|uniref:Uncharacterized protein n=1 Tax=Dreissena polymorpha TaxID=45954 RepID=A0A9D4DIB9_DREPO|nr:hypothetical protein DPMN_183838 [Dreissena polymorpha]